MLGSRPIKNVDPPVRTAGFGALNPMAPASADRAVADDLVRRLVLGPVLQDIGPLVVVLVTAALLYRHVPTPLLATW